MPRRKISPEAVEFVRKELQEIRKGRTLGEVAEMLRAYPGFEATTKGLIWHWLKEPTDRAFAAVCVLGAQIKPLDKRMLPLGLGPGLTHNNEELEKIGHELLEQVKKLDKLRRKVQRIIVRNQALLRALKPERR